jgi:YycE-like N-terminal domain/YycE-like C-terminal domain
VSGSPVMRVARPTDRLEEVCKMYVEGLGLTLLAKFEDHDGFDGAILGFPESDYHIEFTSAHHQLAGGAPSSEHLIVFYLENAADWERRCASMLKAGFVEVKSANPYWTIHGRTFADVDDYRVVLCNSTWRP